MADNSAYTRTIKNHCPLPVDPGVMSIYLNRVSGTTDQAIPVPWKNVRLTYILAVTLVAVATSDLVIKVELNAAGGTLIDTLTVGQSGSAIGDVDTLSYADFTSQAAAQHLRYDDTARDYINFEIAGSANAGAVMMYAYFEREAGQ